jgi:hypothetical protein
MKSSKSCEWVEGCPNEPTLMFPIETVNGKLTYLALCSDHAPIFRAETKIVEAPIV